MRKTLGGLRWTAVVAAAVMAGSCGGAAAPAAPDKIVTMSPPGGPPAPPAGIATISGTVWVHTADGIKPFANQVLFGWVETERGGSTTGRITIDDAGRYSLAVPIEGGTRVRINVGGAYQPCAVTLTPQGNTTQDVHVVTDHMKLGASLPPQLAAMTPTLSGMVYEITADGRQPVKDVRVELDGLDGLGLVIATTMTDAAGRYLLCAVPHLRGLYLFASKPGYKLFETGTNLLGQTTLDIELRR